MMYQFTWQEDELTSTISENCFCTESFSTTFSHIALMQGTVVGEQITESLGENVLKTEPEANS